MNIIKILKRWASEFSDSHGRAAHVTNGVQHRVILNQVRVILIPDGGRWFAQGIDINYATDGATLVEAQQNFERGLSLTLKANLQRLGHIDRIMATPPAEAWMPLIRDCGQHFDFSMSETHDIHDAELPYRRIQYIEGCAKAA